MVMIDEIVMAISYIYTITMVMIDEIVLALSYIYTSIYIYTTKCDCDISLLFNSKIRYSYYKNIYSVQKYIQCIRITYIKILSMMINHDDDDVVTMINGDDDRS